MSNSKSFAFTLQFPDHLSTVSHIARRLYNYPTCEFKTESTKTSLFSPQEIRISDIIHGGERTTVYLGRCDDNTEVALKFSSTEEDIVAEAGHYQLLEALQGRAIPLLYGVLSGKDTNVEKVSCIVLERFGDRLERDLRTLDKKDKANILTKLAKIHHAGLNILEFSPDSLRVKTGDYRIVNLRHMESHEPPCAWTYNFFEHLEDDDVDEQNAAIQCEALKSWAEDMNFWDRGRLFISSCGVSIPKSDRLPPQSVVDRLRIKLSTVTLYPAKDREEIARRFYGEIWRRMAKGVSVEELEGFCEIISHLVYERWHTEKETYDRGGWFG